MKTLLCVVLLAGWVDSQQPNTVNAMLDVTDTNAVSVFVNPFLPLLQYKPPMNVPWNGLCVRGQSNQPYGVFIGAQRLRPGTAYLPEGILDLDPNEITGTVYGTTNAQGFECYVMTYPTGIFSVAFQAFVATPATATGWTLTAAVRIYRDQ